MLRQEKLGVAGSVSDLRLSDGGIMVSAEERVVGLVERRDARRNLGIGRERTTGLESELKDERREEEQP